jgi:hypothetical protein
MARFSGRFQDTSEPRRRHRRFSAQHWRERGFPVANRFMVEHDTADQKHLRQISQSKLVVQAPGHHEGDDVGQILGSVQNATTPLVELLAAGYDCLP